MEISIILNKKLVLDNIEKVVIALCFLRKAKNMSNDNLNITIY